VIGSSICVARVALWWLRRKNFVIPAHFSLANRAYPSLLTPTLSASAAGAGNSVATNTKWVGSPRESSNAIEWLDSPGLHEMFDAVVF
jgi:hypothetical protein